MLQRFRFSMRGISFNEKLGHQTDLFAQLQTTTPINFPPKTMKKMKTCFLEALSGSVEIFRRGCFAFKTLHQYISSKRAAWLRGSASKPPAPGSNLDNPDFCRHELSRAVLWDRLIGWWTRHQNPNLIIQNREHVYDSGSLGWEWSFVTPSSTGCVDAKPKMTVAS